MKKARCAYLLLIGIVLTVLMTSMMWSGSYDPPKCHQFKQRSGELEGLLQKYRHLIAGWIKTETEEAHPGWTDLEFIEHAEEILSKVQNKQGGSLYAAWKSGQSPSKAATGEKKGEKNEKEQPQNPTPPLKMDDKSANIPSSDWNLKGKPSTQQQPELNYTVTYRQAQSSNYLRLFSYDDQGNCQDLACKWSKMPGATMELVKSAPEVFEKVPLHFLENFKNPCWLRADAELNCLPYFYVIGMAKCGTTDVWDKIVAHPDVVNVPKEPHWWGPRRHGFTGTPIHRAEVLRMRAVTGGKDDSSLEWYLNLYKSTGVPVLINSTVPTREGRPYHPKVFGDSSISTSISIDLDWMRTYPNTSETLYTNADLIRAVQPNAKIILMVRDPTVRAWSWYWYSQIGHLNSTTWHNFVVENIKCFQECVKNRNLRYCAYAPECPHSWMPELQVAIYHVYLRDWINAFSRDRVLVIRLEDWQADSTDVYRQILKFLDLRQLSDGVAQQILHRSHKNVNKRKDDHIVDDFYRPYNKELALLMNDDRFLYPSS